MMKDAAPTNKAKRNSPKESSSNKEVSKSKHFVTIKHQTMIGQLNQDDAISIVKTHPDLPSVKNYFQTISRRLDFVLNENNQLLQITVSEQKSV